jgi:hypothetical protein
MESLGVGDATGVCEPEGLWQAIRKIDAVVTNDEIALVIHYSGYGYDPDGAPAWLANALERRPSQFAPVRIVTFFHELYATGRPWQRAFWTSRRQRAVAIRIAQCSDEMISNREQSARWLEQQTGRPNGSIYHLPVCSNVGEPEELLSWECRSPRAVLFGGRKFKESFLKRNSVATIKACKRLNVSSLVDVGTPAIIDRKAFQRADIAIEQAGWLPGPDVSRIMGNSQFTFIDYHPGYIAKSGVLAAAAAHGSLPIVLRDLQGGADGFYTGQHCIDMHSLLSENQIEMASQFPVVSRSIRDWYESHSLARHAIAIGGLIDPRVVPACTSA